MPIKHFNGLLVSASSISMMALGLTAQPVWGQSSNPGAAQQDAPEQYGIQDIVVTANKREQKLNDVGISVTAIGASQLQERQILSLQDIAQSVPGLTFSPSASNTPVYTLRGVGFNDTTLGAYPDVSVYLDQAPLPFPVMTKLTAFDLERIEVLKGPQGTLFGNNATGGAINYIAAKPTNHFEAGASIGYGRFNQITGDAYVSGPVTETLGVRLSGHVDHGDDWQKSYSTGEKTGRKRNYAGRLLVDWQPTDRLRVNLNLNGWLERGAPQAVQVIGTRSAIPGVPNPVEGVPLAPENARAADFSSNIDPRNHNDLWQIAGRIDFDMTDDITVTSLTSYTDYKQRMSFDGDGVVENNADFKHFDGSIKSFSQELRLANAASNRFRWVIGGNYSSDKAKDSSHLVYGDSTIFTGAGIFESAFRANQDMKNYAAFANGEFDIGAFTLKGGVRYTKANRKANSCFYGVPDNDSYLPFVPLYTFFANNLRTANGLPPIDTVDALSCMTIDTTGLNGNTPTYLPGEFTGKLNEDNVSWRAGIDYKPRPGLLLYANVSKGYKAGSFPSVAASTTEQSLPVKQESLLSYEAGIKATLLDRTLQLNAAGFYYDYRDRQIRSKLIDPNFGVLDVLVNVPKSSVAGFEVELNAQPIRGFNAYANFTYLDSEIKRFVGLSAEGVAGNFKGDPLPYTPKYQIGTGLGYEFDVSDRLKMSAGADLTFRSETNAIIGGSQLFDIRDYTLLDLRAGIKDADDRWSLQFWGKNVTNEYYWTNVASFFDTYTRWAGQPATYGATFSVKFK
jgi:iron complex outermembrane receptor protein